MLDCRVVLLHKLGEDPNRVDSWRSITLSQIFYRLYICARMFQIIQNVLPNLEQVLGCSKSTLCGYYLNQRRHTSVGPYLDRQVWQLNCSILQGCCVSVLATVCIVSTRHMA
eukprot:2210929-Amphidinium_carterae.1